MRVNRIPPGEQHAGRWEPRLRRYLHLTLLVIIASATITGSRGAVAVSATLPQAGDAPSDRAPQITVSAPSIVTGDSSSTHPAIAEESRDAAPARSLPLTAQASFAADVTTGVTLHETGADVPLPPGSTTKIVTAVLAMRLLPLERQIAITEADVVDQTVYSNMGLLPGDVVTVRDLFAGLLINSAGDAANALARAAGMNLPEEGEPNPVARFVREMNRYAKNRRMKNTTFLNPSGRDEPGHVSSARDLAIAADELFRVPALERFVGTRTMAVEIGGPSPRSVRLYNTNELLGESAIHGVKTGTTDAAGQCLVLALWRGDNRIITVVLGSADRWADSRLLIEHLDETLEWVRLGRGMRFPELNAALERRGLTLQTSRTFLLTQATADTVRYEIEELPWAAGDRWSARGSVVFYADGETILRLPVFAGDSARASHR